MKTFLLSWKLFLKKPFSNAALAIELAVTLLLVTVFTNVYQYSRNCISVIQNSKDRLLYCSDPNAESSDSKAIDLEEKKYQQTLKTLQKKYPYIKGFTTNYLSDVLFTKDYFEKGKGTPLSEGAEAIVYDPATFSSVQYPLSSGKWPRAKEDGGKIPCVIGGIYAGRYQVGDVIPGYALSQDVKNMEPVKTPGFRVEGILALPQQCLQIGAGGAGSEPASSFFNDMTNRGLFLIVPGNLFSGAKNGETGFNGTFLLLDRSCTPAQIDAVRNELHRGYTELDTEITDMEEKQIGKTLDEELPFLIVLFLVVFLGLIAVTMLTTMKNMQTFKIYYLTGCPKRRIILMMFWYVLFYFVFSGILFAVFYFCLKAWMKNQPVVLQAYLILQPSSLLWIGLVCAVVMACSLVVPAVLIHKNDLASLLRKD